MSEFAFGPERPPFSRWMGPYSLARGDKSGIRVRSGVLGAWMKTPTGEEFCPVVANPDVQRLTDLVRAHFRGGRVLMLPTGHAIKPLQDEDDLGKRVLIGRFAGSMVLQLSGGRDLDLANPGVKPGEAWPGPSTLGLECTINSSGLFAEWAHPSPMGRDTQREQLLSADPRLFGGFRLCRPNDLGGRVRVTAHGHVTTNRQEPNGEWVCRYVGWIAPRTWPSWEHHIQR